jgi:hypothetical protein
MKKTVKCSGCGKEHEIITLPHLHTGVSVDFKPVESARERLCADAARWYETISCEGRLPHKLYLGKQEMDCWPDRLSTLYGFEAVEINKDSYFHATSKAGVQ